MKYFTKKEIAYIEKYADLLTSEEIAAKLNRSSSSVRNKIRHMRDKKKSVKKNSCVRDINQFEKYTGKDTASITNTWGKNILDWVESSMPKKGSVKRVSKKAPSKTKAPKVSFEEQAKNSFESLYGLLVELYTELENCWQTFIKTIPDKKLREQFKNIPKNEQNLKSLLNKAINGDLFSI